MPSTQLVPWFDVHMWAQVVMPFDAELGPWTVLPFNGLRDTTERLTRELWRQPFSRQVLQVPPYALATLLVPDPPEAVAALIAAFGPEVMVIETQDPGRPARVMPPVLHEHGLLIEHLRVAHNVPQGTTRRLAALSDAAQYHAGLHQQVAMYPPRQPHWHG